tara:strand:- start:1443 stop:2084 length:642 start_codon:yes stop_codon:yes gene_type:complete
MNRKKVNVPPELVNYDNLGKMALLVDLIGQALGDVDVELVHKSTQQGRKHEIIFRTNGGGSAPIVSGTTPSNRQAPRVETTDGISKPFGGRKVSAKPLGSRRWSTKEEELLIEYALNGWDAKQIGEELKRTDKAIHTRLSKLRTAGRVPEKSPSREGKEWTEAEDTELLKLHEQRMSHGQIAVRMGRTPRAVGMRLWKHFRANQIGTSVREED